MKKYLVVFSVVGLLVFSALLAGAKSKPLPPTVTTLETVTLDEKATSPLAVKPITKTITHYDLRGSNVVTIIGPIGAEAGTAAKEILELGETGEPVWVLIDSPGGSVIDGAQIVSAIQSSKSPVYTVCLSLCASMAFIIHQYGTERYMVDRSILMAHPATGGSQGTLQQMRSRLTMISNYVEKLNVYISHRAGIDPATYANLTISELWMDAEVSLQNHFADKIVSVLYKSQPTLPFPFSSQKEYDSVKESINLR